MKLYLQKTVYEAALERIRWLYDEFDQVFVSFSGGKDSTVCLHLALQVAAERGRLPLRVLFIDQEAEWQMAIDYIRTVMSDPRVKPLWLQVPFKIFNATSGTDPWLQCWEPGKTWIREREPESYHENVFGTDRFGEMFNAAINYFAGGKRAANIGGMRCEESPSRLRGLTHGNTYKGQAWGKVLDRKREQFTFYPIYDWSLSDVWKAIHDEAWKYCPLYDFQYRYGIAPRDMRVSNVHHETAVKNLFYLQEVEPETWERIVSRLSGVNTVGKLRDDMLCPKELPFMFASWAEYRDYLVENLVTEEADREDFRKLWKRGEGKYDAETTEKLHRMQVKAVLANDHWGVKIGSFGNSHQKNVVGGVANDRYHERQAAKRKDRETTKLLIGKRVEG